LFAAIFGGREIKGLEKNVNEVSKTVFSLLEDVRTQKFPRTDFCKRAAQKGNNLLLPNRQKHWRLPPSFWSEHVPKNTLYLKNRASLANKVTMSVSHKDIAIRSLN